MTTPRQRCPVCGAAVPRACWRCGKHLTDPREGQPAQLCLCAGCSQSLARWLQSPIEPQLLDGDDGRPVLVGVGEAARRVRRTPGAVRRLIKAGKLPARTNDHDDPRGRRYLVRVTDLDRLRGRA